MQVGMEHYNESDGAGLGPLMTMGDVTEPVPTPIRGVHDVRAAHVELFTVPFVDQHRERGLDIGILGRGFERSAEGSGFAWLLAGGLWLGAGVSVHASHGRVMGAPPITRDLPPFDSFQVAPDPCSTGGDRTPLADVNCGADGVPERFVDYRRQMRTITGVAPAVGPESATTSGFGVRFVPRFARSLSLSVDYLETTARDAVTNVGARTILASCYERAPDQRSHCDRIVRDRQTGKIVSIDDRVTGQGTIESASIDAQLGHDVRTRYGHLRYHVGHLWVVRSDVASGETAFVGRSRYLLDFRPRRKLDLAVLWDRGRLRAGAHVRVLHGSMSCDSSVYWLRCWQLGRPAVPVPEETRSYTDVFGSYAPSWASPGGRIAVGIRVGSRDVYMRFVQPL
jgi:hypothetical protein